MAQLFPGQDLVYILMSVPMDEASLEANASFLRVGPGTSGLWDWFLWWLELGPGPSVGLSYVQRQLCAQEIFRQPVC